MCQQQYLSIIFITGAYTLAALSSVIVNTTDKAISRCHYQHDLTGSFFEQKSFVLLFDSLC